MKLATIEQVKAYMRSDPSTWKEQDKRLKEKDRDDNIGFRAYYGCIIKYLELRQQRK